MKIKTNVTDLAEALKKVAGIKACKVATVLNNALIEAVNENTVKITTTNLDLTLSTVLNCEVLEKGAFTLPVVKLLNIVSTFSGNIELETTERVGIIRNEKTQIEIEGITASEFPKISFMGDSGFKIETSILKEAISKLKDFVYPFAGQIYSGINIAVANKTLEINATDGNRLARYCVDTELEREFNITIPQDLIKEILKIESDVIEVATSQNSIYIQADDFKMQSTLLSGKFPNTTGIIPKDTQFSLLIDTNELLESLNRCNVIIGTQKNAINFVSLDLKATSATVNYKSTNGKLEELIFCQNNAGELKIAFNPAYLTAVLKNIKSEQVEFNFNSALSAFLVKDGNFLYLLMPLQVK